MMGKIMDKGLPTLGIAAFSGTGKTSLLKNLIPILKQKNIRTAIIKHAHHDFDIDLPGKDSYELRRAGADQMLISSAKRFVKITEVRQEIPLQQCLAQVSAAEADLVLVEGYKMARISKIELHRPCLGFALLYPFDKHIIAVASDQKLSIDDDMPVLDLKNVEEIAEFIVLNMDKLTLSLTPFDAQD